MSRQNHSSRLLTVAALALAAPLAFTACAGTGSAGNGSSDTTATQNEEASQSASAVTFTDSWVKAADGMTGAFGVLENTGDSDLVLESAESAAAGMVELHETTTDGKMREVDGGFTIPAGETFTLEPGGNHIMLMELARELLPGDEVDITLNFSDGTSLETTSIVKEYSGANENYGDDSSDDSEMDMDMDAN